MFVLRWPKYHEALLDEWLIYLFIYYLAVMQGRAGEGTKTGDCSLFIFLFLKAGIWTWKEPDHQTCPTSVPQTALDPLWGR